MMSNFKKVLAVVCSLTVMAASGVTAFAAPPTSNAGTGNVLAYSLESVIVPSDIKVALNPQRLAVTTKGTGNDAVTSTNQVVSFNYGIANLSTAAKDVKVKFAVTGTPDEEKTPITFVDTAAAATYGTGDGAAKDGELKMYLAIVAASATPTTNEASPAAFAVTAKEGANEHNATAANLADVKMTAATGGEVVFAEGDDYANATIAFKLGETTYAVQDGETVDWTTTQDNLASKMEATTLGDVTGFTITGTMNTGADWTEADVKSLTFTPTYEVSDVTGDEVATEGGGNKQINVAAPAPTSYLSANTATAGGNVVLTLSMPTGVTVSGLTITKADSSTVTATSGTHYTISGTTLTLKNVSAQWSSITVTYSDSHTDTITVTSN